MKDINNLINIITSAQELMYHLEQPNNLISPNIKPQTQRLINNIEKSIDKVFSLGDENYQESLSKVLEVNLALMQKLSKLDVEKKHELLGRI